jgi:N-acetylglutamate synthase-like GNAT family acetyltransferase
MTAPVIVPYREEYRQQAIDLVLHIQNVEAGIALSLEEQPDLLAIEQAYVEPGGGFWIALDGRGDVAGTIGLQVKEGHGIMKKFFVREDARGRERGVSAGLYDALLRHARGAGLRSIILDTPSVAERSHTFYRRAGFRQVTAAELPFDYRFPNRDSLLFQLDLPTEGEEFASSGTGPGP